MNNVERFGPWTLIGVAVIYLIAMMAPPAEGENRMHLAEFGALPLQDAGRVKPFDTLARNSLMIVSAKQTFEDEKEREQPAIRWLLDVMTSGPLFQLSATYLNGAVRDIILVGAAFSAFGAAVSEAMAGSRLLMALSRDGTPSSPLARISMPSGAPRRAVELIIAVNVVLLLIFQFAGVSGFTIWQYLGTLGTLGILVGYAMVCIAASRAALNGTLQIAKWKAVVPILAAVAVFYTLYNELIPAPAYPYNVFPYVTLAWLVIGAAVVIFAPHLAKRMGDGLIRTLGVSELGAPHHHGPEAPDATAEADRGGLAEEAPPAG